MIRSNNRIKFESIGEQLTFSQALENYIDDTADYEDQDILNMQEMLGPTVEAVDAAFTDHSYEMPADELSLLPEHNMLGRAMLIVASKHSECDFFAEHCRIMVEEYDQSAIQTT